VAETDAAFGQVVGSHFNVDFVADHDADADLSHTLPVKVYTSDYVLKIMCGGN
jgi:hypothetical protein